MRLRLDEKDKKGFLAFWELMKKKNVQPTISTYNQMLHLARILRDREWYEQVFPKKAEMGEV
jgi:hypothetical protein